MPRSTDSLLQTPVTLGALSLPNRVIMSPTTRLRANEALAPPGHARVTARALARDRHDHEGRA